MTVFRLSAYQTPDIAIAGATLNTLAIGGYAWGPEIDNSTDLYPYGSLSLALSGSVTSLTPAYLQWYLVEPDGSGNYPASSGDPGQSQVAVPWNVPGGSGAIRFTGGILIGRILAPKFKIAILNKFGVAFPADNSAVCQLRRFGDTGT